MSYRIEEIEGIGPAYMEKLTPTGIKTTDDLLKLCCDKPGRSKMAETTGISEKLLLTWANLADLMRIKGIGRQYSEVLEVAGVDTVKELANRNATNLADAMKKINEEKKLAKSSPSEEEVAKWIGQAKEMDPLITH